jgi:hydroxymethylpyrimidine kinase / phosphomethylpyrimidine kinase / thiamine-phosphate diphosphorylase
VGLTPVDRRRARLGDARLYLVSAARTRHGRLADLVPALAAAGVDVVQLRDRSLEPHALLAEARACAAAAEAAGVLFLVNDSPELARACGADGVHIGQDDATVPAARALLGPDRLVGRSTRGGEMLDRAADEGADYASVGPVWATPTKPGRPATGLAVVADAARRARLPWFAVGAIDARRAARIGALGARRAAVVRAVTDAPEPAVAAALLRARLVGAVPRVLSVAGTDSGGGAGLLADAKAIVRAGGFPMCAVTAVTAQTTVGVEAAAALDVDLVRGQITAVTADLGLDAVKTGMLAGPGIVEAVGEALARLDPDEEVPVVVDPVVRAESGASLLGPGGEDAYRAHLLPRATVATPNLFEARALAGRDDEPEALARELHARHGCAVLVTGGHGTTSDDVLCDDAGVLRVHGPRLPLSSTHGAGCTHSATLAALLASGVPLREAAALAKRAATGAVAAGRPLGAGAGPVDVMAAR